MSTLAIKKHEQQALRTEPVQVILLISFFIVCLYAVLQGTAYRHSLVETTTRFVEEEEGNADAWRDRLVAIENGSTAISDDRFAGLAMDVTFPAALPPGTLADLSHGVSDVKPATARISLWRSVERLFSNYQVQSPINTAAGSFDMAFVIIFMMPLLMIALSYDMLSSDRELGRLRLIMAQPVSMTELIATKLRVRFSAVAAILGITLLISLFAGTTSVDITARLPNFAVLLIVTASYFLFWVAVIGWVISKNLKGETTALILTAIWIFNSLVGPAILSASAESLYPTPSRLAFLSDAREASNEAYKSQADIMQGMLLDHPDLTAENYSIPEYIRTAYLVTNTVDRSVKPVLEKFDQAQADRKAFLSWFQYASPAVLTLQAFNLSAGTDLERYIQFERSVRNAKLNIAERIEANVLAGERLTLAQYEALPRYQFQEQTLGKIILGVTPPVIFMLLLSGFFGRAAYTNLRQLQSRILE